MSSNLSRKFPRLVSETMDAPADDGACSEITSGRPDPNPYLAGEVIGDRYRLVRELGRGGMGVVWVGYALALGVEVAVKLIRASAAGPAISTRMAREAHAAARLGHPALVRVFDFGWTSRGDPYLVMELVQGETLSAALEREERINAIRAVQMLLPLADGLRLAHDRSIVHRDIKPDNIFLATDPLGRVQPKLLDFGIAKVGATNVDGRLTQMGVVLGSPEYMSPEQAVGVEDVDERTDVWSLSVVLYEMVTGNVPHRKANYNALMYAIVHDDPQPMTNYEGCDASLWEVVSRGLAKDRDQRWHSMVEFGEALALWLYEHGIKEDICGNSIRAVWLDGALSTAKIATVPAGAPGKEDTSGHKLSYSPIAETVVRGAARGSVIDWFVLGSHRHSKIAAAGVIGLALCGSLAYSMRGRGSVERADAAIATPSAVVAKSVVSAPPPDPTGRNGHMPEELPQLRDTSTSAPAVASVREPSGRASGGLVGAAKSRASQPAVGAPKTAEKAMKKRRDFGF